MAAANIKRTTTKPKATINVLTKKDPPKPKQITYVARYSQSQTANNLEHALRGTEKVPKTLAEVQKTSDVQGNYLHETNLQLKKDKDEQRQALDELKNKLADLEKTTKGQTQELEKQKREQSRELAQTKKALVDLQTTSYVEKRKLQKTILQMQQSMTQQTEAHVQTKGALAVLQETSNIQTQGLEETNKELADVQKSNNEFVVELMRRNMLLERDNNQQTQVIQVMSARQAAMEQMLERLEQEFRRPIVTDETGDQELEELDE